MTPRYHVYVAERGNVFMTEIAAVLAAALADTGRQVVFPAPGLPEPGAGRVNLVVAPHEFFALQRGVEEPALLRAAEASVSLGVEQPGTRWFELGTHYASVGPAVLDISSYAVEELRRRGLDATHLQLGYHSSWDRWGGDPARARPTDLLFLGSSTPRRNRILSELAPLLWDCEADIRLFEFPRPMAEPRAHFVASSDKWELLASSRVLMNIHRNEVPYFEWVRVLEAVLNGCLVVTEASTDYGPLVPGEHLVVAPVELVGAYTSSLLIDEPLRAELAAAAYDLVRTKLELTALLEPICEHLEHLERSGRPGRPGHPGRPGTAKSGLSSLLVRLTGQGGGSRQAQPLPPPETAPPPDPELIEVMLSEGRARNQIKALLDSETRLVQHVEALQSRLRFGVPDHAEVSVTEAWEGFEPEVSVVISLFDYEQFVAGAIESVMASEQVAVELVVVDDHSRDRSMGVVRSLMTGAAAQFPVLLAARSVNGGVGAARELGIAKARADRVFVLDADNTIYPNALRRLSDALDADPDAAFSYGIIAKVDQSGLLSHLPWDVARLTTQNYIDAMALIRRPVFERLGGYDRDFSLRGWEDYEFWLRLAANGERGAFVPQFVGAYRVHPASRQQTVGLDTVQLSRAFVERYPFLPWPEGRVPAR